MKLTPSNIRPVKSCSHSILDHVRRGSAAAILRSGVLPLIWLSASLNGLQAETPILVPNSSFESPQTVFADPQVDSWEMTPQPIWYDEGIFGGPWQQLTGVFLNTSNGSPDHIDNLDGDQAAFLFALPEVGLFQDYDSVGGTNNSPTHEFDAVYQTGRFYKATVGVVLSYAIPPTNGATLQLSLYYRDALGNRVTIASASITNNAATFPSVRNLVDLAVCSPMGSATAPWAGEHVGIQVLSTVGFDGMGGIWDLDNVRLVEVSAPQLTQPIWTNGQFGFTLLSDPGSVVEILTTTNVSQALSDWITLGVVTNVSGTTNRVQPSAGYGKSFYSARQLP